METMLFGTLDHMLEVPCPQGGIGWVHVRDSEDTPLLSGGRHVYRAPVPFMKYSLDYKGGTPGLRPLVDIYTGIYGDGPFYQSEFNFRDGNVLPTRWATGSLLGHVARDWCDPAWAVSTAALSGRVSVFENVGGFVDSGPSIVVPAPGVGLGLCVYGSASGAGSVRVSVRSALGVWSAAVDATPSASPTVLPVTVTAEGSTAVRLELYCPTGSTLTIDHINLSTIPADTTRRPGEGVGPVQFMGDLSGSIQSTYYDQIGLSLDLVETDL